MDPKTTDWRAGPNVCRCCLAEGCYKDISTEYFWMGKREVYAEMLSETLNLSIAYSNSGGPNSNSRLICELCISRLRDASDFKRQVQECERTFLRHLDPGSSSMVGEVEVTVEPTEIDPDVKLEHVKQEKAVSDDDDDFDERCGFDEDDDDDLDDQPLTRLASRIPKKESVDLLDLLDNTKATEKRKSSSKTKTVPAKKAKTIKKDVKATSSKAPVKTEKKKKEPHLMAKENAEILLRCSTMYPFRLRGKSITCVYCCEGYEDPAHFRRHADEHHQHFNITTAFYHMSSAKEYIKVDIFDMKCRLCLQPFEKVDEIAEHLKEVHEEAVKRLNLDYDIGVQPYRLDSNNYSCYHCDKKMPSVTTLCRHTILHYKRFTCDTCGRNYLSHEALKYHIKVNHSDNHVCRKCWREFSTMEEKRDHIKSNKKCWTFCCIICGERFQSWEQKQKHLEIEHGQDKIMYKCPDCDMNFSTRKYFYTHYKLTHTDEGFQCACCGMKFNTQKQLDDHTLGHTGEKQFVCNICSKTFVRQKSLTQHMWIHSDTKRFVCLLCEKQFNQKVSLKSHMKTNHPEVNIVF
ncbi:zinc finger protein 184-like isoform X12 [Spodoptera litura]|uniref:Zinc finger protein 184-like isoform X12 n=1 Tax=Spodoptera litura TaxID=69820 RepID=A0A9J7DY09_SPOLT|nr:zinc finger protein 184-like isoform X12 [Spodoptera litura]